MLSELLDENRYLISQFIEHNISVNVHIIVYPEDLLFFPASIQLISAKTGLFEYHGGDFAAYKFLPSHIKNKVCKYAQIIGERLRNCGFLGVCGIDFITTPNEVYFSEINPRFQSSTFILNLALKDSGAGYSIQHLHLDAFLNKKCSYCFDTPNTIYSFYKYTYSKSVESELLYLKKSATNYNEVTVIDDSLSNDQQLEENTYLFKLVFNRRISAISANYTLTIHQNLLISPKKFELSDPRLFMQELKIMLLLHGVTLRAC